LSSIVIGSILLWQAAHPGATFGQSVVIDFGTPFWSLSVTLTILVTLLIAGRLIYRRELLRREEGRKGNDAHYTSLIAIFAESGALYAICGIIYIPLFARNLPIQFPFSGLFAAASSIAPNLLILTVALTSENEDKRLHLMERKLAAGPPSAIKQPDGSGFTELQADTELGLEADPKWRESISLNKLGAS